MKSRIEEEFEVLFDEYFSKFERNYPLDFSDGHELKWHVDRMKAAIKSGKACPEPVYDDDIDV